MEETKGTIITYPIPKGEIWDDMSGVLCSGSEIIDIVKVDHLTPSGNYYVTGDKFNGVMEDHMYLAKLYVKNIDGKTHQLKFAQWKIAIKSKIINTNKPIKYILLPSNSLIDTLSFDICAYVPLSTCASKNTSTV